MSKGKISRLCWSKAAISHFHEDDDMMTYTYSGMKRGGKPAGCGLQSASLP
jgi:hypothetical protein